MTKLVQVAAAIIQRPDGSFLLGQRAPGTFYPGYWEFPGGKVEPGESARDALIRELREELDIEVTQLSAWITRRHVYEHAHVCLNFFRVTAWNGELRDHVHSALSWQAAPAQLTVSPMLPANGPILKAMALPNFYGISQTLTMGKEAQLEHLERALSNGLRLVQVREPAMAEPELCAFASEVVRLSNRYGARVLINSNAAVARTVGASGVHLPSKMLMHLDSRPDFDLVGASCHNRVELEQAARLGVDFAVLGPVKPTRTHPDQPALGWERYAALVEDLPMPVFALGGLVRDDVETARMAGGQGVAAIRGAWDS